MLPRRNPAQQQLQLCRRRRRHRRRPSNQQNQNHHMMLLEEPLRITAKWKRRCRPLLLYIPASTRTPRIQAAHDKSGVIPAILVCSAYTVPKAVLEPVHVVRRET
jgi:hypothetical protein